MRTVRIDNILVSRVAVELGRSRIQEHTSLYRHAGSPGGAAVVRGHLVREVKGKSFGSLVELIGNPVHAIVIRIPGTVHQRIISVGVGWNGFLSGQYNRSVLAEQHEAEVCPEEASLVVVLLNSGILAIVQHFLVGADILHKHGG